MGKTFKNVGYERYKWAIITIDEMTSEQYEAVLAYTREHSREPKLDLGLAESSSTEYGFIGDMEDLESRFHQEMLDLYWAAGKAIGYWANYYLRKVRRVGGIQAAKEWLQPKKNETAGLERLARENRLDLSVEALVLREPWDQLFTEDELKMAKDRLDGFLNGERDSQNRDKEIIFPGVGESVQAESSTEYGFIGDTEAQFLDEMLDVPQLDETVKKRLQDSRIGQERFRGSLMKYWNGRCAVTGFDDERILRASHIKPWHDCDNTERLDPFNGLLLIPNLDAAFDKGLITFDEQGMIVISSSFLDKAKLLGITDDMKIKLHERHHQYLAYHRENVFAK